MKIKKSYIIGIVVVVLLAVFIVMGVTKPDPHAGHDHGDTHTTGTTAATQPAGPTGADLTPEKSYTLKDNKDGTYSVSVTGRSGNQIHFFDKLPDKPTFTELNQDVLEISNRSYKNPAAHWAVYCDIQNHRTSKTYGYVLAALDHHVAYVEKRSGNFHVFVSDVFDEEEYLKAYELTGAVITESGSPEVTYTLDGSTMTVTYQTEKGKETITIKMFAE